MSEKSINSLIGMLSTKKLPDSGILKTTNNSIQGNQEKNSFLARLVDSIKNTHTPEGQPSTTIQSELDNITSAEDIDHLVKQLSMGSPATIVTNDDGNQTQLSPEVKTYIPGEKSTNVIIDNNFNSNISTESTETNTLLEYALPNNQESEPLHGLNTNLLRNAQKMAGESSPEQMDASFPGKLNTTQNNTQMNEQKILEILNNPGQSEAATENTDNESVHKLSKLPGQQDLESHKEPGTISLYERSDINKDIVTGQTLTNTTVNQNSIPAIEKADSNPIPDAYKISNNTIINPNTSSHTEESAKDKIHEILNGQLQDKAQFTNAGKNTQSQQDLMKAHIENSESPIIFDVNTNTAETKAAKLFDNTTLTNNNGVHSVEDAIQVSISSDNSTLNNQGTDTAYDFNTNSVNISHKTEPDTNFNNTLSQINNSTKPLGSLGNGVADDIIQNAKLYLQGGKSEVKMQLNPPELGTLKLEFTFEDDILETKIIVERSAVKDVIEKDISRLRELISNADIDVGKLDVSLQDKENGRLDFMNKDFHSDSESKGSQDFSNQESEYYEEYENERTVASINDSNQINYLV